MSSFIYVTAAVFLLLFIFVGCEKRFPRHYESGLNSRFCFDHSVAFEEYIEKSRQMIEGVRLDINDTNRELILNSNSPFQLFPDRQKENGKIEKGILLIHGLLDSPYSLKSVAGHFCSRGFLVRTILLPGHGTIPGDLLRVDYREWIKAVEYGIDSFKKSVEHIYLGGVSMGAALSVHQGLKNPNIDGLILFSPALKVRSKWASVAGLINLFIDWWEVHDDLNYAKYESLAANAGVQAIKLTHEINRLLQEGKRLTMPVFAALSVDDFVADQKISLKILSNYATSAENRFVIYDKKEGGSGHEMEEGIIRVNSSLPEKRVIDFSHPAVTISPDDPHYGEKGEYKDCLHYKNKPEKRNVCARDPNVWKGEVSNENLKRYTLRRLTYNPLYDQMMEKLDEFLEKLG